MKKILIPTDFSAVAANAMAYAIEIAGVFKSEILLYHVYSFNKANYDIHFTNEEQPFTKELEGLMKKTERSLEATLKEKGLSLRTFVEEDSMFALFDTKVKKRKIDMIVMGSKGASGINKIVFGSTAATALDRASVPVLVVPPEHKFHQIQNIVLAIDQIDIEPEVFSPLQKFASKFGAKITLLNVVVNSEKNTDKLSRVLIDGVETIFRKVPLFNSVNETIEQFILKEDVDILCMIRKKKGIFKNLLQKSSIRTQVFSNRVPLLILPEI